MSLDVWLDIKGQVVQHDGSGIFIREDGQTKEISQEEWNEKFPGREPVIATPKDEDCCVYSGNITHNLAEMATAAEIYKPLWEPDEIGITMAAQLIGPLLEGLGKLKREPEYFRQFNPPNGWGDYEVLVSFVERYLEACKEYPSAEVSVWR